MESGRRISADIDHAYAAILIRSTMDSILNPSPVLENELIEMDLNKYQNFNMIQLINRLLRIDDILFLIEYNLLLKDWIILSAFLSRPL